MLPVHVPFAARSTLPRARTPVNDGALVFVARVVVPPPAAPVPAVTTAVVDDCTVAEPDAFRAVTATAIVAPTSTVATM